MEAVRKALWFVESHSREALSLEAIAQACGVSAFHLTRTFAGITGLSLMRYVRGRRLSEAARHLARGSGDILSLALDAGYGSHEAFTRAFRDHFALTPGQLRARGHLKDLNLVEALDMQSTTFAKIETPHIERRDPFVLAGIVQRHDCQSPTAIPDQWQRFAPHLGHVTGQIGDAAYGATYNVDENGFIDYMTGVQVAESADVPKEFQVLRVPAYTYAIFAHREHISAIRSTYATIWGKWFPESVYQAANAPTLEVYGAGFDGRTGLGGLEIWIPVERK